MTADQYRPRINLLGFRECPEDWQLNPDRSLAWTDLDMWFLVGGEGAVETPDGRFKLEPGTCLLMRGGEGYTFSQNRVDRLVGYYIHFDYIDDAGEIIPHQKIKDLPRVWRSFPRLSPIADLLHRAWQCWKASPPDVERATRWFEPVLMEVADFDKNFRARGNSLQDAQKEWVFKLAQRIEASPQEFFSVAKFEREAGYSRTYFYRIFRKYLGVSPQQFIIDARMRQARSLLTESNYSIAEIAKLCGYNDVYFFSRHFKLQNGMNPSHFRQKGGRA